MLPTSSVNTLIDFSRINLSLELCKICNINCDNCFIPLEKRLHDRTLFKKEWIKKLAESKVLSDCKDLTINILGGELSVLSVDYLEEITNEIRKYWKNEAISIVSNFYNLKPSFLDYYQKHSIVLETTFDFGRKTFIADEKQGREDFLTSFKKNIEEFGKLSPEKTIEINMLLNRSTLEYGVENAVDYFASFNIPEKNLWLRFDHAVDFKHFMQNVVFDSKSGWPLARTEISYEDFGNYVLEMERIKNEKGIKNIWIPQVEQKDIPAEDRFYYTKGNRRVIAVSSHGDVAINAALIEVPTMQIGNISTDSLDDCIKTKKYNSIYIKEVKRALECQNCEYYSRCERGCLFLNKDDAYGSKECVGIKSFFKD